MLEPLEHDHATTRSRMLAQPEYTAQIARDLATVLELVEYLADATETPRLSFPELSRLAETLAPTPASTPAQPTTPMTQKFGRR